MSEQLIKCAACGTKRPKSEIGFLLGQDLATKKNGVWFLCADRDACIAAGGKYEEGIIDMSIDVSGEVVNDF